MMLIINADDFGLSDSVNRAITNAFKNAFISDTTMMANGEYFDEAAGMAKQNGFSDKIGIHFNLTEGIPLTDDIKKYSAFCENGVFHGNVNRLNPLCSAEKSAIYKELSAQVTKIKTAGFAIDHADSHHHIHTAVFIAPIVSLICKENSINKIRIHRNIGNIKPYKMLVKNLYNRNLRKNGFITTNYFGSLDDINGAELPDSLEIMVHPDYDENGTLIDRRDFISGFPAGVPLYNLSEEKHVELKAYGDL